MDNQGKLIATINGEDKHFEQEVLGVNMETPESDILAAVSRILTENILDGEGDYTMTVRKVVGENLILVFPKTTMG